MTETIARGAAKHRRATTLAGASVSAASARILLSESALQRAVVERWRLLGTPGSVLAHIPNGEYRNPATAAKLKTLGTLSGLPDLLCSSPSGGLLFIELKRPGGRTSPEQRDIHDRLRAAGVDVFTIDDLDEAVSMLEARGVLRKASR